MSLFLDLAAEMDVALEATKHLVSGLETAAVAAESAAARISSAQEVADRAAPEGAGPQHLTSGITGGGPGISDVSTTATLGNVVDYLKQQAGRR